MARNFKSTKREDRVDAILDVLESSFLTHGYSGTKMSEVAKTAGITSAALYWYFPSKDDALAAVQTRIQAQVLSRLASANLDPLARLEAYLEIMREEARPLHRMMHERYNFSHVVAKALDEVHESIADDIRAAVRTRGRALGESRIIDVCMATIEGTNATNSPLHSSELVRWVIERMTPNTLSARGAHEVDGTRSGENYLPATAPPPVGGHFRRLSATEILADAGSDVVTALLTAAITEFAALGYEGTSTRQICSRAGLSHTAMYAHFRTKEELLYKIISLGHGAILAAMRAAAHDATSPGGAFDAAVGTFVLFQVDHSALSRVAHYECRALTSVHHSQVSTDRRAIDSLLRGLVSAGNAAAAFECSDVAGSVLAIQSMAIDISRWHDAGGAGAGALELAARYVDYARVLVGALAGRECAQ